eukprot:scaffold20500_cov39-Cyclotella_meneghiniana.AAC.4
MPSASNACSSCWAVKAPDCGKVVTEGLDRKLEESAYRTIKRREDGNLMDQLRNGSTEERLRRTKTHEAVSHQLKVFSYLEDS